MTGAELIKWLQDNHAEDKEIIIEHRDSGGSYWTAEHLEKPQFVKFADESLWGVIENIVRFGSEDFDGSNGVML
jgi:hypothetical protein